MTVPKYFQCLREYVKLYREFREVIGIIKSKIVFIDDELKLLEEERKKTINNSNSDKSPMKNLKEYENQLNEIFYKSKCLFVEKEMLEYSKDILCKDFGIFGDRSKKVKVLI